MPQKDSEIILAAVNKLGTTVGDLSTNVAVLNTKFDSHLDADITFKRELCAPSRSQVIELSKASTRSLGWLDILKVVLPLIAVIKGLKHMGWI